MADYIDRKTAIVEVEGISPEAYRALRLPDAPEAKR